MAGRFETMYATVPLSGTVSTDITVRGDNPYGLWSPVVTSCAAFLQVSFDQTSANFVRLLNPVPSGSGDLTLALGAGSRAITMMAQEGVFPFAYARVELGVPQAAVRSFAIISKLL